MFGGVGSKLTTIIKLAKSMGHVQVLGTAKFKDKDGVIVNIHIDDESMGLFIHANNVWIGGDAAKELLK